jgi:bifunctional non-homologous end joining protein LigD
MTLQGACIGDSKTYFGPVSRTYMPCLPTRAMEAPSGQQWVHEIKHDGYRLLARKVDGRVRLYTKQGHDWSKKYPLIAEALYNLWSNCFGDTVRPFDLLELNGEDYRAKPLAERKKRLARLLARPRDGIEYVEHPGRVIVKGVGQPA